MNRQLKIYIALVFVLLFFGCRQRLHLEANEYADWMSTHSKQLMVTAKAGKWFCSLAYLPAEWMALQEAEGNEVNKTKMKKIVDSYRPLQHYVLKISTADTTGTGEMLNTYFPYQMQKDIFLIENSDTLSCTLYHFENTFSLTGEHTFNLGFENKNNSGDKTVIIRSAEKKFTSIVLTIDGGTFSYLPLLKSKDDAI